MIKFIRLYLLFIGALWLSAQDVKIMTLNVRVNVDPYPNDWNTRQWRAINMLKLYNPDVIGLQEDEWVHVNSIMQHIPGMKMATEVSTGIMYQSNKLRVIQAGKFWLSNTPDAPNGSFDWGQLYIRRVQWVILENFSDGKRFYVYNNHWDIVGPYARLKSAQLLTSRIDTRQFLQYPVVVTGDMNAPEVEESVVHLKNKGTVKFRDTFRELYPNAGNVGTFHGFGGGTSGPKIDFILLQQGIGATLSSEIIHYNENRLYPTDHFPIIARLSISGTLPPAEQKPYSGIPSAFPGTLEVEHFDTGGQDVAFSDTNPWNVGNIFRNEGVDLEVCNEGGYNVGWTETGEWMEYTIDIKESATYWLHAQVASTLNTGALQYEIAGNNLGPAITVAATGGWQQWKTLSQKVILTSGVKVLRIKIVSGGFNINKLIAEKETSNPPGEQSPFLGVAHTIPGIIEAEHYDLGGSLVAWSDLSATNEGNSFRTDAVDLEVCQEGGYNLGWTQTGEWLEYSVKVTETSNYSVVANIAAVSSTGSFQLELNNEPISPVVPVPASGGWQIWRNLTLSGIRLTEGSYLLKIKVIGGGFNLNKLQFVKETSSGTGCSGQYLQDYTYRVSSESNNPSITFNPVLSGVGASTLILYYGTGAGPYPGYRVYPSIPFKLNVSSGQTIRFYYTYSHPAGGERNSSANMHSLTVGSCAGNAARSSAEELFSEEQLIYPNPLGEHTQLYLKGEGKYSFVKITNTKGEVMTELYQWDAGDPISVLGFAQGLYFLQAEMNGHTYKVRFIK
ncbi:MAG: carbohydrate-binding protein [Cytophagaceae bacterium]|jgi:endonuclease/exonuclease/phosphatase family metal-dependent hydrolase|nr:carbohydrate-binding protein [Cytophagaceae bacterium]